MLRSTLMNKTIMALSGLWICIFLVIHLAGNLQLILPAEIAHESFNNYAHLLSNLAPIKIASYVNFFAFAIHTVWAFAITKRNNEAKPEKYAVSNLNETTSWASRNMIILGVGILIFFVIHLANFWFKVKIQGETGYPMYTNANGVVMKDVYTLVIATFKSFPYMVFYSASMAFIGYHLVHGVYSSFRTLGLYHRRYLGYVAKLSVAFAAIISIGYAVIPAVVFFTH